MITPYILLTPDAVHEGRACSLIEQIEASGLRVTALSYTTISSDVMLRIYGGTSYGVAGPDGSRKAIENRLVDLVFDRAPGIVVDLAGGEAEVHHALKLKGATDPLAASAVSLRRSGRDPLFNGVHSPDSIEEALVERALIGTAKVRTFASEETQRFKQLELAASRCTAENPEALAVRCLLRAAAQMISRSETSPWFRDLVGVVTSSAERIAREPNAVVRRSRLSEALRQTDPDDPSFQPSLLGLFAWLSETADEPVGRHAVSKNDRMMLGLFHDQERFRDGGSARSG